MVTLEWMNRLRNRLNDYHLPTREFGTWKDDPAIIEFLKPIIDYGLSEEHRITEALKHPKSCECRLCNPKPESVEKSEDHVCNDLCKEEHR